MDLVILGAGGLAREVRWAAKDGYFLEEPGRLRTKGFINEDVSALGAAVGDLTVLGGFDWFDSCSKQQTRVLCAVGSNDLRRRFVSQAKAKGMTFVSLIAETWRGDLERIEVGEGCLLLAGSVMTTDIKIGNHVNLNIGSTFCHDVVIEDYVNVNPGCTISGNVTLREGSDIGTGAKIIPGVTIGKNSIIGAGSVVVRDIPDNTTAVGVPCKVIKQR